MIRPKINSLSSSNTKIHLSNIFVIVLEFPGHKKYNEGVEIRRVNKILALHVPNQGLLPSTLYTLVS